MGSDPLTGWQFDQTIPAIVHPIVHHKYPLEADNPATPATVDWIVVVLSLETIQKRILPELTRLHFESSGNAEYSIRVATLRYGSRTIYDSSPDSAGTAVDDSDAAMNIFGPPPETTEGSFWEAVKNGNSVKSRDWHNFSAPVWFPVIHYTSTDDPWMLILKHNSGRLEDVVGSVRRSNLLISSVVLLLLAANISLVVIAGHRAQSFARLQMDFVASISHELRTPLTAIFSAGQNLEDGVVEEKAQLQHYGGIITSQSRQLVDLVDEILTFASTRAGEKQYSLQPINVTQIINHALKRNDATIRAAGFSIEQQIEPDLPEVMGDLNAIALCLQDLLLNALKYSGKSHWIRISAALIGAQGNREVCISVEDHGIGISRAELTDIFKPFYRSAQVKSAQIHGTGLGLAVAKRIAEAMGGYLTVESELNAGSVFTLHLPAFENGDGESQSASGRASGE